MNKLYFFLLSLFLIACATSNREGDDAKRARLTADIGEKMARETEVIAKQSATSEDQFFSVETLGNDKIAINASKENYYYLTWSIGTQIPMECYLYKERLDIANMIKNMSESLTKTSDLKQLAALKAGAVNNRPYLLTNHFFVGEFNNQKVATSVKVAVAGLPEATFACVHSELGYGETFEKVFRSGLAGLNIMYPFTRNGTPVFSDVSLIMVDSHPFGFTQDLAFRSDDRTVHYVFDSLIAPTQEKSLNYQDTVSVAISNSAGLVERSSFAKVINGELNYQLVLEKQDLFKYYVKGKMKNEEVDKVFTTKAGIDDIFLRAAKRKKGLAANHKNFLIPEYLPEIKFDDLVAISYSSNGGKKSMTMIVPGMPGGEEKLRGEIDSVGHISEMEIPSLKLLVKRAESATTRNMASQPEVPQKKNKD